MRRALAGGAGGSGEAGCSGGAADERGGGCSRRRRCRARRWLQRRRVRSRGVTGPKGHYRADADWNSPYTFRVE
jgi:hypothetical protein